MFTVGLIAVIGAVIAIVAYLILMVWSLTLIWTGDGETPQKLVFTIIVVLLPFIGALIFMFIIRRFITASEVKDIVSKPVEAVKEGVSEVRDDIGEVFE